MSAEDQSQQASGFFYLVLTSGVLIVIGIASVAGLIAGADAGSYADWLAAVATLAAFAAAVVAARFTGRTLRFESARETARLAAERETLSLAQQSQAALVAAWASADLIGAADGFDMGYDAWANETQTERPARISGVRVNLRNASNLPVTGVVMNAHLRVELNGRTIHHHLGSYKAGVLGPTMDLGQPLTLMAPEPLILREHELTWPLTDYEIDLSVEFRDARGRRWIRGGDGRLVDLTDAIEISRKTVNERTGPSSPGPG